MKSIPGIAGTQFGSIELATADVADFLCEDEDVPCELLGLFDELEAVDAIFDLKELCRQDRPQVWAITIYLDIVLEALERLSSGQDNRTAHIDQDERDFWTVVLWYRLTVFKLLTGFCGRTPDGFYPLTVSRTLSVTRPNTATHCDPSASF